MKTLLTLATFILTANAFAETFIVEMKHPLTQSEIKRAKSHNINATLFDRTKTDYFSRTYSVEAKNEESIAAILPTKLVERIHKAQFFSLSPARNPKFIRPDQFFHFQWGLYNQGQSITKTIGPTKKVTISGKDGVDIRWKDSIADIEGKMKKNPIVAVIDMGIDLNHPDLKDQIFRNEKECDENGNITDRDEDRDNNGLAGDCMGWNFAGRNMYEARRPQDDNGHGTHVAGIIAATSNKIGVSGVSSKIKILPIRVTGAIDEDSNERRRVQPLTDRIAKGILYATNMGADVINLSMGWTKSMDTKYLNEAMTYALSRGVVIVAAAGNNNNNASIVPCSSYDVICVGATSIDGSRAEFSNYGGEVDVMAPGEEIFSTFPQQFIPRQFNFQGYDVLSGTSQATPFVSALAALLRGVTPNMHRDEINKRIVQSADASDPEVSQAGMINFKKAFEVEQSPLVRPIFKRFSIAMYDGSNAKFSYALRVKNFGSEGRNLKLRVTSLSRALSLSQEFAFDILRPGEIQALKLVGDVVDETAHNQVKIKVEVIVNDNAVGSYQHEFRLVRDILKDSDVKTIPFAFKNNVLPVGKIDDSQVRNLINTVETFNSEARAPEFYLPRLTDSSIEIKLFRLNDASFQEVTGTIALPGATQLLNVMKLDVNLDGQEDYLIRAIACEENCSDPQKALRYIQYTTWDKNLKPLFGDRSIWKFLPTIANVDLKSQRFVKLETKDFGTILSPTFIESAGIPDDQQELKDAFSLPDRSRARRVYYLSPELKENDKVDFLTKTISTPSFLKDLKISNGADETDEIQAVSLLAQSPSDLSKGIVKALFTIGRGFQKKNVIVNVLSKESSKNASNFQIRQNIWGYEHQISQNLDSETVDDAFIGLTSQSQLTMVQSNLALPYSYRADNSPEAPLGAIASFNNSEESYTFFQTPSYLMLARRNQSTTEIAKLKINRFSFLPGVLFTDSFYPVVINHDGKGLPALYVDETDIQSDMVSITMFDGVDLKSPINRSSYVPPICKAMNPARLEEGHGHSFTLLCLENRQWVMKFREIH